MAVEPAAPEASAWSASVDAPAARRWERLAQLQPQAPWLHEEVGERLLERIDWVQLPEITAWANWHNGPGGVQLQHALQARWPQALCYAPQSRVGVDHATAPRFTTNLIATQAGLAANFAKNTIKNRPEAALGPATADAAAQPSTSRFLLPHWLQKSWDAVGTVAAVLKPGREGRAALQESRSASARVLPLAPPAQGVQIIVANMLLHSSANPGQLLQTWQQSLATGGVLFFTCLGPDTLAGLQQLYQRLGWPPPLQRFVDMHDWGDALVNTGFATPVMEMERLTLTYSTPSALLQELRQLGRNLHPQRFSALRGRTWLVRLEAELEQLRGADGRIALPVEIIYGHAFKPAPVQTEQGERIVSLEQLRRNIGGAYRS